VVGIVLLAVACLFVATLLLETPYFLVPLQISTVRSIIDSVVDYVLIFLISGRRVLSVPLRVGFVLPRQYCQ